MAISDIETMINPKSVAVVGASNNPTGFGYFYTEHLLNYGFKGAIYPINPKVPEIMGLKSYPSLEQAPGTVEYVICCIALTNALSLLDQCSKKGVKVLNIMSGRGAETGRAEAKQLEIDIKNKAKSYGIRLLGPNCLGVYNPKSGLSLGYDFPKEPGTVGALLQSGGNSTDTVRFGSLRGLRFSKVISYGNAVDINQNDLLEYFSQDEDTRIVLCYVEGLRGDPRKFMELLRSTSKKKPVIVCKAGRTSAGARQSLSHTASLAGSGKIFEAAVRQAGAIPVKDLDEMVNLAVAFDLFPPIRGKKVALGGGGGGRNVVSADEWEEHGFEVPAMPQEVRDEWKRRGSQIWDWVANPADFSILVPGDPYNITDALLLMGQSSAYDILVATLTEDMPFAKDMFLSELNMQVDGFIQAKKKLQKAFAVIFTDRPIGIKHFDDWRWRAFAESRARMIEERIPIFNNINEAATAVRELVAYYLNH
jgi:acyl-CoA synthetase (NDP forming)